MDIISEGDEQKNLRKSEVLCRIGYLLDTYHHDYASASDAYKQALKLNEENHLAHFYYASYLSRIEQNYNAARKHYLTAVLLSPRHLGAFIEFLREVDKNPLFAMALENLFNPPLTLKQELDLEFAVNTIKDTTTILVAATLAGGLVGYAVAVAVLGAG